MAPAPSAAPRHQAPAPTVPLRELGAEVVAILMDEEERARASAADWGLDRLEIDRFSEPGLFVIRADGTVFFAQTQSTPSPVRRWTSRSTA